MTKSQHVQRYPTAAKIGYGSITVWGRVREYECFLGLFRNEYRVKAGLLVTELAHGVKEGLPAHMDKKIEGCSAPDIP